LTDVSRGLETGFFSWIEQFHQEKFFFKKYFYFATKVDANQKSDHTFQGLERGGVSFTINLSRCEV
jgi:hypothetical protein